MDYPFKAITLGRPWPREDLLEVQPAAAEVVGEDEVLPCLVVLYSVFGLVENTQGVVVCECVCVCQRDRMCGVVSSFCNQRTTIVLTDDSFVIEGDLFDLKSVENRLI